MDDALRRAGWILVLVVAVAYGTFRAGDAIFNASNATTTPTVILDAFQKGQHRLTGMLFVKLTCEELSVKSESRGENAYELRFETWPEPSVPCLKKPTLRGFDTIVFAPSNGIHFTASLNAQPFPIAVYRSEEGQ